MRRRHRFALIAILTVGVGAVAACSPHQVTAPPGGPSTGAPRAGAVLIGQVEPVADIGGPQALIAARAVAAATDGFGLALFARLCAAAPTSNLVMSPASAAQALGMLAAGADAATRTQLSALLGLPGFDSTEVAAIAAQSTALHALTQVSVSNRLFEQVGVNPSPATLNDLATAYDADLHVVDFTREPSTTKTINHLVDTDTDGLIPHLFDTSLDASTQTVLTDAIVLHADWTAPFTSPSNAPFTTAGGGAISASTLSEGGPAMTYQSAAGWQAVTLPYAGGQLAAVALLPPAGAGQCAAPSPGQLQALSAPDGAPTTVQLPTLHLSTTLDNLKDTLHAMGLPTDGDYSGYGPGDQLSEVVQKATLSLDARGTTAAAATGIAIATSAERVTHMVALNRPFLLLLRDTETGTPLFLARIADPTAS